MDQAADGPRNYQNHAPGECHQEDVERRVDARGVFETPLGTAQATSECNLFTALTDEPQNLSVGVFGAADQTFCVHVQNVVSNLPGRGFSHPLSNVVDTRLVKDYTVPLGQSWRSSTGCRADTGREGSVTDE